MFFFFFFCYIQLYIQYLLFLFHFLGGYAFTSVPTSNRPHDTPIHFFHFSPVALATIFQRAGFEIIKVGYWGNRHYKEWLSETNSWPTLEEMIARYGKEEAIQNDPLNPVQTWILARKPVKNMFQVKKEYDETEQDRYSEVYRTSVTTL